MSKTRRQFLLGSTGLAASAALVAGGASTPACKELHAQMAASYRKISRSVDFAANNIISTAMDVACPCCGEPLFKFG
jgi:hypothetical protein